MTTLSQTEARRFILRHQGLLNEHRFEGRQGVLDFVRKVGCVQFDPVDICGRSPDLTLLSRVKGFKAGHLQSLLYDSRELLDHFDKQLSIYHKADWQHFARLRQRLAGYERSNPQILQVRDQVLGLIEQEGPKNAAGLGIEGRADWYWASSSLARAALEKLYFEGELLIHSKKGTLKTYDLAQRILGETLHQAEEPHPDEEEHLAWWLLRRVRAVGLLWNRASDAFLGAPFWYKEAREKAFDRLIHEGRLQAVHVEGIKGPLYIASEDVPELEQSLALTVDENRCELIAPLDSFLWDRKLIKALFDFDYTWEIYTKPEKRIYGAYVLPILMGDQLVGRVEPVCERKKGVLTVRGLWWEEGVKPTAARRKALNRALNKLAKFNGCALESGV